MALNKQKTLVNGAVGEYWKVTHFTVDKMDLVIKISLELFKSAIQKDIASLGVVKSFEFPITLVELTGDLVALCYAKVKAFASSDVANLDGNGTHKGDADLNGAIDC